jgi:hypothetical protein
MKTFTNIRRISPKMVMAGIAAVAALLAAVGPAGAVTPISQWGAPGPFLRGLVLNDCAGVPAVMTTYSAQIGASSSYTLPQTIEMITRVDYSVDGGRNWLFWTYLPTVSGVANTYSGLNFYGQRFYMPPGYSYRVFEFFNFKWGNSYVGSVMYAFNGNDYHIEPAVWGTDRITATTYSAGCTVVA